MKIIFFEVPKREQDIFLKSFSGVDISFYEEKLNESNANLAKDADIVCIFVNSLINKIVSPIFFEPSSIAGNKCECISAPIKDKSISSEMRLKKENILCGNKFKNYLLPNAEYNEEDKRSSSIDS